jgi:dTMP kinase
MTNNGIFVTFEGPNGCGKSTIMEAVCYSLGERGFNIYKTQEPTATPLGNFARSCEKDLFGKSLAYIVAEDRRSHLEYFIRPALRLGNIVLCDRYIESSLVLQKLDGLDTDFIWSINHGILIPDLSIILIADEKYWNNV